MRAKKISTFLSPNKKIVLPLHQYHQKNKKTMNDNNENNSKFQIDLPANVAQLRHHNTFKQRLRR